MFIKRKATKQSMLFRKPLYGVGINDAEYMVTYKSDGKLFRCEIYKTWSNMLKRCYCDKDQIKNPTYKDCYVCDDWLKFSVFSEWMIKQNWRGKQLDKDLMIDGNKMYSPDTCVFVDSQVNSLFSNTNSSKGFRKSKNGERFEVRCRSEGKEVYLGSFEDAIAAKKAYIDFKVKHTKWLAEQYSEQTKKIILNKLRSFLVSQTD